MSRSRRSRGSGSGGNALPPQVAYNIALGLSYGDYYTQNNRDVKAILDKFKKYTVAQTRASGTAAEIQGLPARIEAATGAQKEELKHALNVTRKKELQRFQKNEKSNLEALQKSTFELWNKSDIKKLAVPTDRVVQGEDLTYLASQLDAAVATIATGSGSGREPEIKRERDD